MKFKKYIFVFVSIIVFGCTKDKTVKTIEVDLKGENNQARIEIIKTVRLESSDSSIIGEIKKLRVGKTGYYILDNKFTKTLLLFSKDGSFINKVSQGKGPGECSAPLDYIIDTSDNSIVLFDLGSRKLIHLDDKLNFISEVSKEIIIKDFERVNNSEYLVLSNIKFEDGSYSYVLADRNYNIKKKIFPIKTEFTGYSLRDAISTFEGTLFLQPMDYNIYRYSKEIIPQYYIDFGPRSITQSDKKRGYDYIKNLVIENGKIDYLDYLFETKEFISFSYVSANRNEFDYCIYSKRTKKSYNLRAILKKNDLPYGRIVGTIKNHFIISVEPSTLPNFNDSNQIKQLFADIKPYDNNILFHINIIEQE